MPLFCSYSFAHQFYGPKTGKGSSVWLYCNLAYPGLIPAYDRDEQGCLFLLS
jgi:TM2 domain-containing membrane protein YozV